MKETNLISYHWMVFNKVIVESMMHGKLWTRNKDPRKEYELNMMRRDRINMAIERWRECKQKK